MGNEQHFQVESNLEQAVMHLIKFATEPGDDAYAHWAVETDAFLHNAGRRYRLSMRRAIDLEALWPGSVRRVTRAVELQGRVQPAVPAACPFTLDELVAREPDPRDPAARLASAPPSA